MFGRFVGAVFVGLALTVSATSAFAAAAVVGSVTKIQGGCTGLNEAVSRNLAVKAQIHQGEVVSTAGNARLEITFVDGTKLTLGEKAKLTIDSFVFTPTEPGSQLSVGVTGAFRFVSGQMTKIADSTVTVTTPVATLGVRGTNFWGGPIDGATGVVLFEGQVSVATSAGISLLNRPGVGVDIARAGVAPNAVTVWPQAKVARALATVTFR